MSDPRFHKPLGPFSAAYLARAIGAELRGDGDVMIRDVGPLSLAGPGYLSFLDNPKYTEAMTTTKAQAIVLADTLSHTAPAGATLLIHDKPYQSFARLAQLFYPIAPPTVTSISPHAVIDPSAKIGLNCIVEAGAVIGANAVLGDNVRIAANTVVGQSVAIGDGTWIGTCVSLSHCLIGQRVRILPGARIGQEGFGFAIDTTGHIRIPQLGRVIIEDDVEIGANSTIDRGAGPDTVIGRGTMIDNLVQIGHNVVVGPGCILVAQMGISGSSVLEAGVVVGGQAGITGHLKIGRGAQIAGQSGVMRDVPAGTRVMGTPAIVQSQFFRQLGWLDRMVTGKRKKQE
jgi:UDP-3-O-[3-hydroxymyristoyl] glucosamine N-acyltransferase